MHDTPPQSGLQSPLRTVLLLDSPRVPRWVASVILDLLNSPIVRVVGIATDTRATGRRRELSARWISISRVRAAWRRRAEALPRWYLAMDTLRYPVNGDDPFALVDMTEVLRGIERIDVFSTDTADRHHFDSAALERFGALEPDVGINFGSRSPRGSVLSIPIYGIWSLHHGSAKTPCGRSGGFWEVFLGSPATGAILQQLSENLLDAAVLASTWTVTDPVSVTQNRALLYRSAAPMLLRKLRELHRRGRAAIAPTPAVLSSHLRTYTPRVRHVVFGLLRIAIQLVAAKLRALRSREHWRIEYRFGDTQLKRANVVPQVPIVDMTPLNPPIDRLWADPFPVEQDGVYAVFFEELLLGQQRARIAMTILSPDARGKKSVTKTVLEMPYHVSYPFLFQHDSVWYLLPEMAGFGAQKLFRARSFPDSWEFDSDVDLGQPVVDATLHFHDGLWWLFAGTCPADETLYNELSIFHSSSPLGPWVPHIANPVLSDARSARPAGRLYWSGDALIRPAQDCTPEYGDAIVLKKIVRLDLEAYEEVAVSRIEPDWAPRLRGTHTLNAAGRLTVTDTRVLRAR